MLKTILLYFLFLSISFSDDHSLKVNSFDSSSQKFSSIENINQKNLNNLELIWKYTRENTLNQNRKFKNSQSVPLYTGNSLIFSTVDDFIISLDPSNGNELWKTKVRSPAALRGLSYKNKNLYVPSSQGIIVIDETTGEINKNFGKEGFIGYYGEDFLTLVPPIVEDNQIIVAHQKKIEKYSLPDGQTKWSLDLNGARIWSPISYNLETNTIVAVTSNLINLIGNTNINPDYSNSLLLIDSNSGKIKCKFKDTEHDHWDLDMVGQPIIFKNKKNEILTYGFSKTGNIFVVNLKTCKLVNNQDFEIIETDTDSDIPNQIYSKSQKKITKKKRIIDLSYNLDEYLNYLEKNNLETNYIKHITRNSIYGKEYIPLSLNKDVLMFGIHGGFEWPGGSLDLANNQIIIPSNHYPWIIRSFYTTKKNKSKFNFDNILEIFKKSEGQKLFENKCQSCHSNNREGFYENEFSGGKYIPSLIGASFKKRFQSFYDLNIFNSIHKYSNLNIKLNNEELAQILNFLKNEDEKNKNNLEVNAIWQLLLDQNGNFASIPPWGKITAFNLDNLEINWQVPFGVNNSNLKNNSFGDINFGGILSTNNNIFIATGTPDNYIRIFSSSDGIELWKYKMEAAGSAPPMTYVHNNEEYIVINASGGKFYGYNNIIKDRIYAFKLKKN